MPLLIDENLKINFLILGFNLALDNIANLVFQLANEAFNIKRNYENIELDALIGVDLIKFFSIIYFISCMPLDAK